MTREAAALAPGDPGRELLRKGLHVALGLLALVLRWVGPWPVAGAALAAAALNRRFVHRLTRGILLRPDERERGSSHGVTTYPLAVGLLILAFHARLELAAAAWGLLAFGDGMATVAGRVAGRARLPWNPHKTWVGFLAFVAWGTAAAALLIRWTQAAIPAGAASGGGRVADRIGASFLATRGDVPDAAMLILGCLVAACAAALAESAIRRADDNLVVAFVGGAALYAATLVEPQRMLDAADALVANFALGLALALAGAALALAARGVDRRGAAAGIVLGAALCTFAGWRGFLLLAALFALGSASTQWGARHKEAAGIAEPRGGRRGAGQALANAGAGVAFAFLAAATAERGWFELAMVAAFATAAADTVSSEIGQVYGRRPWHPIALRRVAPGTPGAVSLAGTLAGGLAGATIAAAGWSVGILGPTGFVAASAGALAGSSLESLLAAHRATRARLGHDTLNAVNTLTGAAAACLVALVLGS